WAPAPPGERAVRVVAHLAARRGRLPREPRALAPARGGRRARGGAPSCERGPAVATRGGTGALPRIRTRPAGGAARAGSGRALCPRGAARLSRGADRGRRAPHPADPGRPRRAVPRRRGSRRAAVPDLAVAPGARAARGERARDLDADGLVG